MKNPQMTKSEIIDFVVNHFKTNPRGIGHNGCLYKTDEGHRCAHSICIKDEYLEKADANTSASDLIYDYGDQIHLPQFQGHAGVEGNLKVKFWHNIQWLHDNDGNWQENENGGHDLSEQGIAEVDYLKRKHKN